MSQGVFPKEALNFIFFCNCAIFFVGFACLVKKDTHFILIFNLLVYSSKHFCEAGGSNFIISLWQMRKLRQRKLERFALRLKWTLLDHSLSFPTPDFSPSNNQMKKVWSNLCKSISSSLGKSTGHWLLCFLGMRIHQLQLFMFERNLVEKGWRFQVGETCFIVWFDS